MRIFQNKPVEIETVDFQVWETVNGDSILLKRMRTEYMEQCIAVLEDYCAKYPAHPNREIWERYLEVMEDGLCERTEG